MLGILVKDLSTKVKANALTEPVDVVRRLGGQALIL